MTKAPLISVIIPVYNTEQFLEKCLKSVSAQTFKDFEVLLVNDCSPDGSAAILDKWAKKDRRFRVIKLPTNQGLGGARNEGLREAKADYIASVDSDDWVDPDFLQAAYDGLEGGIHDIVCFGFRRVNDADETISTQRYATKTQTAEGITNIFRTFNPAFWNKLWLKSLYTDNDIFFPLHVSGQDMATSPRILTKAKSIKFIDAVPYNYLVREGSLTFTFDAKHYVDYILVFDVLQKFLRENGLWEKYKSSFFSDIVTQGLRFHGENLLQSSEGKERKAEYLRHLLLLREAYVRHNDHLLDLDEAQLAHLIGDDLPVTAVAAQSDHDVILVSCIIKSFLRPKVLERLLKSIGQVQDSQKIIFDEIIVGDDSPETETAEIHRAIRRAQYHHDNLRVRYVDLGENIGLSAGRNILVEESRNETILLCDDDFIFDTECSIQGAVKQFESSDLEIMGGWLKNKYNFTDHSWEYWGICGKITENERAKIFLLDERPQSKTVRSDYLLNFFLAKRATLLDCPWDADLKVEEHPEFFYRMWKRNTRMALSDKLFVKHTANRNENPPRYNEFRHGKEYWKSCLHNSIERSGKTVRRMYRWKENEFQIWEVDVEADTDQRKTLPLKTPILDQKVGVTRLTPRFNNYSFGYYDLNCVSSDGRYALAQSVPVLDQLPDPRETSDIVRVDLENGNAVEVFGHTTSWCHQQLSQLQFLPDGSDRVIYNVFDEQADRYGAVLVDPKNKSELKLDMPVAAVSPTGKHAASVNFSRLFDYRPGYGYQNVPDTFGEDERPSNDGLWTVELKTGKPKLVLSYERIAAELDPDGDNAEQKWVINHIQYSPSGGRVFMLIRPFSETPPYPTYSAVYDFASDTLERVFGFGSHYHWKDEDVIAISGSPEMDRADVGKTFGVFEVNVNDKMANRLPAKPFKTDGHCSYSPDGTMMLYDSYSNAAFPYRALYVYDLTIKRLVTLGYFWSEPALTGNNPDTRCDLHPRWSADGKTITIDSTHEGFRAVYSIKVTDVRHVIDANLSSMPIEDWQALHNLTGVPKGQSRAAAAPKSTGGALNLTDRQRAKIVRNISLPDRLPRRGKLMTTLRVLHLDRLAISFYKRLFLRTNSSIAVLAGVKEKKKKT